MKRFWTFLAVSLWFHPGVAAQSLIILTEQLPPAQILNADGTMAGCVVDLVKILQQRVGNHDPIRFVVWEKGYEMALETANVLLFTTTRNEAREDKFYWVGPVYNFTTVMVTRKDSPLTVTTFEQAKNLPLIGVYSGEAWDQKLTVMGFKNLDHAPSAELKYKKFFSGRDEAIVTPLQLLKENLRAQGKSMADVKILFELSQASAYLAFSRQTNPALVQRWAQALEDVRREGVMGKIYAQYDTDLPR